MLQLVVAEADRRRVAQESATGVALMEYSHCWPDDCAGGTAAGGLFAATWIDGHALPLETSVPARSEEALSKTSKICARDPYSAWWVTSRSWTQSRSSFALLVETHLTISRNHHNNAQWCCLCKAPCVFVPSHRASRQVSPPYHTINHHTLVQTLVSSLIATPTIPNSC